MIDHTGLGVSDPARSRRFYEQALAPLGYRPDAGACAAQNRWRSTLAAMAFGPMVSATGISIRRSGRAR